MNKIFYEAASDIGKRSENKDAYLMAQKISGCKKQEHHRGSGALNRIHIFAVCDGVGSLKKSAWAAQTALRTLRKEARRIPQNAVFDANALERWVRNTLELANQAVLKKGGDKKGATTIALLALTDRHYVFANVGDTLGYLKNGDPITELSVAQNLAAEKRKKGEQVFSYDERGLLHFLGEAGGACCEVISGEVQAGMQFLLFSDGCAKLAEKGCLAEAFEGVKHFVAASAQTAYADNCTAVLVSIK